MIKLKRTPAKPTIKKKIRYELKKIRTLMNPLVLRYKSRVIMKKLFSLPEFKKAKKVMFYVSFNNEVDTHKMISKALKIKKKIYVPVADFKNMRLSINRIREFPGNLKRSKYGILEPGKEYKDIFKGNKIDIIVVPGIGFDCDGNRIGYGGGFYDRLLKRIKAVKIGLAFDFQMFKKIPTDENDQKLDMIITEKREFNSWV
ncbi:MAG: 5-formyltetrahydrofolate cyclo-ligase [Candidatus Firestonebacteria bacterium]